MVAGLAALRAHPAAPQWGAAWWALPWWGRTAVGLSLFGLALLADEVKTFFMGLGFYAVWVGPAQRRARTIRVQAG